jgi:hypothetical protein
VLELRLRSKIAASELKQKVGRILSPADFNVSLTGPCRVRKPDGTLLCVYVPGGVAHVADEAYPLLTKVRGTTKNRGLAAGSVGARLGPKGSVWTARPVASTVLGAVDPSIPRFPYCRLTAYTAKETGAWEGMQPLWRAIAGVFAEHVPDRYAVQAHEAMRTRPEWVIPETPFTTITVNNSYSTGVHQDKGDLDSGFSCLSVLRRGTFTGGHLVFPEYRVAVELQDGDVLLMDSHEWHGNTTMTCGCGNVILERPCQECGAERISIVAYYRTKMAECGTPADEDAKYASGRGMKL